ncbi:hypothetical protein BX666DRAFT_981761 [Dichotomocladium elegans]|nr:hypothetical protein BX666DRAFT_981761 [Dichotomocladium elegans]
MLIYFIIYVVHKVINYLHGMLFLVSTNTVWKMVPSIFDEIFTILFPRHCLVHRASLLTASIIKKAMFSLSSNQSNLGAVGAFVVYTLVSCLFLCRVSVIFPEISIYIWVFSCLDNFCDGLHFASPSRSLGEIGLVPLDGR